MAEPVTTAEAKSHLRVSIATDDTLIDNLVVAAREWFEVATWRGLVADDEAVEKFDRFPRIIRLKNAPLRSVTTVEYIDINGSSQTVDDYQEDAVTEPGRIIPVYGGSWPSTREQLNAVTITYKSGYVNAAAVPKSIKQGILMLVAHWYENREGVTDVIMREIPLAVKTLANMNSIRHFYNEE